jgi:molybdate transport system ATP-binding protein
MLTIDIKLNMLTSDGEAELAINTAIGDNELLCLWGHSGAGKTTLLRILAGLTRPQSGRIVYNNTVWFDSTLHINLSPQIRNVGYMFQDYALFPNMSVEQNIRYAQKTTNQAEVEELITHFDLHALKKQKPARLSGGQKQRVALARALASKPSLLLLDEPLSALDSVMRESMQVEISKAHHLLQATTILVSHSVQEIHRLASSVIVLKNGKMIQQGKPKDVLEKSCSSFIW